MKILIYILLGFGIWIACLFFITINALLINFIVDIIYKDTDN